MKKIISVVFCILFMQTVFSQQVPVNNFYSKNPLIFNPAAAGIQANVALFLDYRDQWTGFKGAPEIGVAGIHGLITNAMGLGVVAGQNKNGVFAQSFANLNYSFRIGFGKKHSLALGTSIGFMQNKINVDDLDMSVANDPALNSKKFDEALFNAGFGVHYNLKNFNIHLASPLVYGTQEEKVLQTAFGLVSYDFFVGKSIWLIQPSVFYRYTADEFHQLDFNVTVEWDRRAWLQIGYKTNTDIVLGAGIFLKNVGIGYSYQLNRSFLEYAATASHEVFLYFELPYSVSKKEPIFQNSRRRNAWN